MIMILYVDTSKKDKFSLGLYKGKLIFEVVKCPTGTMSEIFLVELERFLNLNNTKLKDLSAIVVFRGPGSYTSLRIGISITNALAWSLNIPIFATKKEINRENIARTKNKFKKNKKFIRPVNPHYFSYL